MRRFTGNPVCGTTLTPQYLVVIEIARPLYLVVSASLGVDCPQYHRCCDFCDFGAEEWASPRRVEGSVRSSRSNRPLLTDVAVRLVVLRSKAMARDCSVLE